VLRAPCYVLRAPCYVLRAPCYVLRAMRFLRGRPEARSRDMITVCHLEDSL